MRRAAAAFEVMTEIEVAHRGRTTSATTSRAGMMIREGAQLSV